MNNLKELLTSAVVRCSRRRNGRNWKTLQEGAPSLYWRRPALVRFRAACFSAIPPLICFISLAFQMKPGHDAQGLGPATGTRQLSNARFCSVPSIENRLLLACFGHRTIGAGQ